jgi:hypothetical protein
MTIHKEGYATIGISLLVLGAINALVHLVFKRAIPCASIGPDFRIVTAGFLVVSYLFFSAYPTGCIRIDSWQNYLPCRW